MHGQVLSDQSGQGGLVRLDGIHALKHARRFGADVTRVVTDDAARVRAEASAVAADLVDWLGEHLEVVDTGRLLALVDRVHSSRVVAFASRPAATVPTDRTRPVVLLEAPRHIGNLGATVRVAAAAGAAGFATTGVVDPWHPEAVRSAAGLQFALPVQRFASVPEAAVALGGPLVALDPDGHDLRTIDVPDHAVLCFGTERAGLSDEALARCDRRIRLPMRAGVSSLNLATSVAVVLYHLGLRDGRADLV